MNKQEVSSDKVACVKISQGVADGLGGRFDDFETIEGRDDRVWRVPF
jgi:hypothetical protein